MLDVLGALGNGSFSLEVIFVAWPARSVACVPSSRTVFIFGVCTALSKNVYFIIGPVKVAHAFLFSSFFFSYFFSTIFHQFSYIFSVKCQVSHIVFKAVGVLRQRK